MYLWQAKKQMDWPQFKAAMQKEIEDHTENENWEIFPRILQSSLPYGQ
jgi:hypothetical protein